MTSTTSESSSFWSRVVAAAQKIFHIALAPLVVLFVVAGAGILASLGLKNLQIGGLIGALLGRNKVEAQALDVANSVPDHRVDPLGRLIPVGTADEHGLTQAVVVPIQDRGIFGNPDTVHFIPSGQDKPVEVLLPTGVKAKDVEHVIVIAPQKFVVTVHDTSGISAERIDDLLRKYR